MRHIKDTKLIMSCSVDKTIKIWNYETYELLSTLNGHTNTIMSVVHIPDSKYIVSGCSDKTMKIWNY